MINNTPFCHVELERRTAVGQFGSVESSDRLIDLIGQVVSRTSSLLLLYRETGSVLGSVTILYFVSRLSSCVFLLSRRQFYFDINAFLGCQRSFL